MGTGAVGLFVLSAIALGEGGLIATYPLLVIMPAFAAVASVGPKGVWVAAALVPLAFLLWSVHLFTGSGAIPFRSVLLLLLAAVLSIVYFAFSLPYGLQYQGPIYTTALACINIAIALFLWFYGRAARRSSTFGTAYVFHICLFAWLGAFAFPWLGEMP